MYWIEPIWRSVPSLAAVNLAFFAAISSQVIALASVMVLPRYPPCASITLPALSTTICTISFPSSWVLQLGFGRLTFPLPERKNPGPVPSVPLPYFCQPPPGIPFLLPWSPGVLPVPFEYPGPPVPLCPCCPLLL